MSLNLFAGSRVSDFATAKAWYERLLGSEPSFMPHATEAVWELAEHRFLYILEDPEGAGRALNTIMVDDLDARVADIASRGIEPTSGRRTRARRARRSTAIPTGTRSASAAQPAEGEP